MRIRRLQAEDEAFLWTVLYHALYVPPGSAPLPPEIVCQPDLARYVDGWMQRPGDLGFAAEVDGHPVGAAWLRCWHPPDQGYGFVDAATPEVSMSLQPGFRGRGIGTALLGRLLAEAARHVEAVSLSVSVANPARRLYERLGFERVDEPAGDSVTMVKRFAED